MKFKSVDTINEQELNQKDNSYLGEVSDLFANDIYDLINSFIVDELLEEDYEI